MMTINTQELRKAAQAVIDDFGDAWYDADDWKTLGDDRPPVVDEQFIAAASPAAVIGLLNRIDALLAERDRLREAVQETVRVIESNPSSITDTIWVTGNKPETLLDRCLTALAQEGS
ncbi:hypothetical protein ACMHYJ_14370 [Castellaniella hirudinis]|uniref:hypothetical protein n=1 Tax=Castellaniella hirudinis TaxID=1144617 RepID=UPI0039C3DF3C